MARIRVNFSQVDTYEALPPAAYQVQVLDVEEKEGKKYPYIQWKLEVQSGEFMGRKLYYRTSLDPKSLWVVMNALVALGEKEEHLKAADGIDIDFDKFIGKHCVAIVSNESYNDQLRDVVDGLQPSTVSGGRRIS